MTRLYLIRHAEAEGNLYQIAQGQANSLLTDRGWRQVVCLEKRFEEIPVDAVYASDLYRTCATASAIYLPKHLPLHPRRDLREINVGAWEQKPWGEIRRTDPRQMENFLHHLDRWHTPGSEPPEQVRRRLLQAIRTIAAENEGKTAVVVSHACALQILLGTLQGISLEELTEKTGQGGNTAVSLLELKGSEIRVVFRDDASHLTDPRFTGGDFAVGTRVRSPAPGLYFKPIQLPEQADLLTNLSALAGQSLSREDLLSTAAHNPTLVGYSQGKPVGVIQMKPDCEAEERNGWISLYCTEQAHHRQGFGVQLLGQAVLYYRPLGREKLRLALQRTQTSARQHFQNYGFYPAGMTEDGREILEKEIGFQKEFLYG